MNKLTSTQRLIRDVKTLQESFRGLVTYRAQTALRDIRFYIEDIFFSSNDVLDDYDQDELEGYEAVREAQHLAVQRLCDLAEEEIEKSLSNPSDE